MATLSVVIPVYNEVESIPHLHRALQKALASIPYDWEAVYVDDGSKDGSARMIEDLAAEEPEHVSAVILRRNFGQTAALAAGIDHAQGEIVVTMDADLQNDPADIPAMLELLGKNYDVVCGWRKNRQDKFFSRCLPSRIAGWLIRKTTKVTMHDYGCTLKAFRREILDSFRLYGEMHRYIPAYAVCAGARITEVPVNHHPRQFGQSKYGLRRIFNVVLDLITVKLLIHFNTKPMHLFGRVGASIMALGLLPLLYLILGHWEATFPALGLTTVLFTVGIQTLLLGLVAEMTMRTYYESQNKPVYAVRRVILRKESDGITESSSIDRLHAATDR